MTEKKEALALRIAACIRKDSEGKRDVCPVYHDRQLMEEAVQALAEPFRGKVDYVAAPEALGFILGSMLAAELEVGFIPLRNGTISVLNEQDAIRASYIDHRDRVRSLQARKSSFPEGSRILLADDWVETAATMQACKTIVEEADCIVAGITSLGCNVNPGTDSMIQKGQLYCLCSR